MKWKYYTHHLESSYTIWLYFQGFTYWGMQGGSFPSKPSIFPLPLPQMRLSATRLLYYYTGDLTMKSYLTKQCVHIILSCMPLVIYRDIVVSCTILSGIYVPCSIFEMNRFSTSSTLVACSSCKE